MAEEEPVKLDAATPFQPDPELAPAPEIVGPPPPQEKAAGQDESVPEKLADVEDDTDPVEDKSSQGFVNRVLARVQTEKRISLIRAWEESEKSKVENKAHKKLSAIDSWETRKKSFLEAELKQIEEKLQKKKAEYAEKMKNKIALIHKAAEEKRAAVEAKRGEKILNAEEIAAKYRSSGTAPRKLLGCLPG